MTGRHAFAYVVAVKGSCVILNMNDNHKGQYASFRTGISQIAEVGACIGVEGGSRLLVLRIRALSFAEPREAHQAGIGSTSVRGEPLRRLEATVVGSISRQNEMLKFEANSHLSPALGAEALPLSHDEFSAILNPVAEAADQLVDLGREFRSEVNVRTSVQRLLGQHVALLGGTGQGKSFLTASVLQQLLKHPGARIVVFDINGEFKPALEDSAGKRKCKTTVLGGGDCTFKVPYMALGRHGLGRLLLPSEKTQRPALNFALERLPYVKWHPDQEGAGLVDSNSAVLFDDCRAGHEREAMQAIEKLRNKSASKASSWPPMQALSCLVAESYSLSPSRSGQPERNEFKYGNVSPLVNRIRRFTEDPQFTSVVDVEGGAQANGESMTWESASADLVDTIFGGAEHDWKLHIVNLRSVASDLLPMILGALLEQFAFEIFRRGQTNTYPTLLVLEEAHHYLRQLTEESDQPRQMLAYERLSKEGRKFGVTIWLSTQRPSEVSATVLAQCGTWIVFRLTSESDLRAVSSAGEWVDRQELDTVASLPRRNAVIFGSSVGIPIRIVSNDVAPPLQSHDPEFSKWWKDSSGDESN